MTSEEKKETARKAEIAWHFIQATPEFPQSPENSYIILRYLEQYGMECTVENLRKAFFDLKKAGKIEYPTVTNGIKEINVGDGTVSSQSVFSNPKQMSMEAALAQLEANEIHAQQVAISKMTKPLLPLPSGGKKTVVWDTEFAMNKLKGPVVPEPDVRPTLVEKKPRRFKE